MKTVVKPLLIAFLLLKTSISFGHQDYLVCLRYGKLTIKYETGFNELEINNHIKILGYLAHQLIKTNFDTTSIPNVLIDFRHDYTKISMVSSELSYGKYKIWEYLPKIKKFKEDSITGIILNFRDRKLNIKYILKTLNYAIKNVESIRKNINSYSNNEIAKILNLEDPVVEKILTIKVYRNLDQNKESRDIDYYFQKNKFHFYNTNNDAGKDFPNGKISGKYGSDILVLDDVQEIVGTYNFGHFVFNTDSTFHFIPQLEDTILGPYKIDSVKNGRLPILKFYDEWNPKKFILFIDNNDGTIDKVAFFPDHGILCQNYQQLEDSLVSQVLNINSNNSHSQKIDWIKYGSLILNVILVLFLIGLISIKLKEEK